MSAARSPLEGFRTHQGPLGWDDLVVGYDFGLLSPLDIQLNAPGDGEAIQRMRDLEGGALRDFEAHLWAACAEAMGKTPRPGTVRWSQAQDRWRDALLREALANETTPGQLARTVEHLYEQVGCPEDMLSMLKTSQAWSGTPATLDPIAVQRFLDRGRQNLHRRYGAA
jgi:hypothetical protein